MIRDLKFLLNINCIRIYLKKEYVVSGVYFFKHLFLNAFSSYNFYLRNIDQSFFCMFIRVLFQAEL